MGSGPLLEPCGFGEICDTYGLKVNWSSANAGFVFWYRNSTEGRAYQQFGPSDGHATGFSHGWPQGETARWGGALTGAADHHFVLSYRECPDSCGTYKIWSQRAVYRDTISNWHYCHAASMAVNEYRVVKDGNACL